MSPFKNRFLYWVWVRRSDRRRVRVSCGTGDKKTANAIGRMVDDLAARARADIIDAVADGDLRLIDVFADYRADATVSSSTAALDDSDLSLLVTEWGGGGIPRYLMQVRRLILEGKPYPASQFRRRDISKFLASLTTAPSEGRTLKDGSPKPPRPAGAATKNRYRAALSVFAAWLVEREVLESNPVRDVAAATIKRRSISFLEPSQVRTLVDALRSPYRPFEALLAGTGMEFSAAARVRRRDIDFDTRIVFANGEKNEYRSRYVEVTEDWAWSVVAAHAKLLSPNAPLFPEIREDAALTAHHGAAKALGLPRTTLHQHRHAFSVMHLRRGCDHQWLKNQLGHAPQSTLLYTTYGLYIKAAKLTAQQHARQTMVPAQKLKSRRF